MATSSSPAAPAGPMSRDASRLAGILSFFAAQASLNQLRSLILSRRSRTRLLRRTMHAWLRCVRPVGGFGQSEATSEGNDEAYLSAFLSHHARAGLKRFRSGSSE